MTDPKCDGRVNFRGMWGHVGLREKTPWLLEFLEALPASRPGFGRLRGFSILTAVAAPR